MKLTKIHEGKATGDQVFKIWAKRPRKAGEWFEIDEADYYYFLEDLPPLDFRSWAFSMSEFHDEDLTDAFFRVDGRFFTALIQRRSPADFEDAISAIRIATMAHREPAQ